MTFFFVELERTINLLWLKKKDFFFAKYKPSESGEYEILCNIYLLSTLFSSRLRIRCCFFIFCPSLNHWYWNCVIFFAINVLTNIDINIKYSWCCDCSCCDYWCCWLLLCLYIHGFPINCPTDKCSSIELFRFVWYALYLREIKLMKFCGNHEVIQI